MFKRQSYPTMGILRAQHSSDQILLGLNMTTQYHRLLMTWMEAKVVIRLVAQKTANRSPPKKIKYFISFEVRTLTHMIYRRNQRMMICSEISVKFLKNLKTSSFSRNIIHF